MGLTAKGRPKTTAARKTTSRAKARSTPRAKKPTRAERNIWWIEKYCRIPEGRDVGNPVALRPFQREELRRIYDNPAGTRRAILSFGRKNAKTTLSAFILLLHLAGPEAQRNGQLYSAAQSREQAAILYGLAAKIVRMSPALQAYIGLRDTAKQLHCPELGTLYRALSAEASTAYGLSPSLVIHDELGQVRGPRSELYDALETATGGQEDPLSIVISTQAPTDNDLLSILIDDAKGGHDPRTIVSLYTADPALDPFSDEALYAANPALGDFLNLREVRDMAEAARRMPARQSEYENLVLNRRVAASSPFISRIVWESCGAPITPFDADTPVWAGLDLSEVADLTALVLIGQIDGQWHLQPTFWLPEDGIYDKSRSDRVPYDLWRDQGHLNAAPGPTVDYQFVAAHLRELFDRYNVQNLAFDRYNFKHLRPWLVEAGFTDTELEHFIPFGQGFASMSPALRTLEADILSGRIRHGNHPVLNMCFANAVVQSDPAGNRKLAKHKSTGRIDGAVATVMARGVVPEEIAPSVPISPWDDPRYILEAS